MASASAELKPPFGTFAPSPVQKALIGATRGSFLRRGFARNRMANLVADMRSGPVDFTFRDAKFRLHLRGSPTECSMLMNANYNREEFEALAEVLSDGDVFVDIGANVGLYTLTVAPMVGAGGRVIAIEPEPTALARLKDNIAANAAANVELFTCAVGEEVGEVSFIQDDVNLGHSRQGDGGGLTVPMQPLADLLKSAGVSAIGALKIDVEGFEDRVLSPFFDVWPTPGRPRMIIIEHVESAGWRRDCIADCLALGYVQRWRGRSNTILERQDAA